MSAPTRKGFSGQIKRGPMAADVIGRDFTQVYNRAARDRRLSRRARGLLLEILSHRDGFGVSMASLLAGGPEKEHALTSALHELERYGYLHRERERRPNGTLGDTIFSLTDMPDGVSISAPAPWEAPEEPPAQNSRSEPEPENQGLETEERNRRSEPDCDFPSQAQPGLGNPVHKKTNNLKKTKNSKNTKSVRPSGGDADARERAGTEGRTDGGGIEEDQEGGPVPAGGGGQGGGVTGDATLEPGGPEAKTAARAGGAPAGGPVRVDASPGVDLLLAIGADHPELLLTGKTLRDQGLMATGLLEAGWPVPLLWEVIARPLPEPLRKTVGAVISGRLKAAASMPVPGSAAGAAVVPHQAPGPDRAALGEGHRWDDGPTPTPPAWSELEQQHDQIRRGTDRNPGCEADDGLCPTLAVVGETRCALHLGWPLCPGHDEYTCPVRTRNGDQCATCQEQARHARIAAAMPSTDDGTCPGHDSPCGRRAMPGDPYCARCRVASQRDRDRVVREWEAVRDAAVAAAKTQEAPEKTPAPF
ncbi:hypothetical protein ACFY8Z_36485 [Streptomyces microflavus]|uniref:hypothetical protein n=1 Tax=Streptomyces microflavus TaxID=1919 RepID=UPI0036E13034